MKYIVTGTGRCGTNFLAKLLCSAGVRCGRESVFNLSLRAPKKLQADSSWMALPYLERDVNRWKSAKIVHLVRNPWDIIRGWLFDFESVFSVWKTGKKYRLTNYFLLKNTLALRDFDSPIDRSLFFYRQWTNRIDELAKLGYSVKVIHAEDTSDSILWQMGIDPKDNKLFNDRQENTRRRCILTRREVDCLLRASGLYDLFRDKAKEYGYESP